MCVFLPLKLNAISRWQVANNHIHIILHFIMALDVLAVKDPSSGSKQAPILDADWAPDVPIKIH